LIRRAYSGTAPCEAFSLWKTASQMWNPVGMQEGTQGNFYSVSALFSARCKSGAHWKGPDFSHCREYVLSSCACSCKHRSLRPRLNSRVYSSAWPVDRGVRLLTWPSRQFSSQLSGDSGALFQMCCVVLVVFVFRLFMLYRCEIVCARLGGNLVRLLAQMSPSL